MYFRHHMHNVWMGGVENYITSELKRILSDGIEEITSHHCVSTDLRAIMYAYHRSSASLQTFQMDMESFSMIV